MDLFPEQGGGSVGCGPLTLAMVILGGLVIVFMMAQGAGFFEAVGDVGSAVIEVIDELWEK